MDTNIVSLLPPGDRCSFVARLTASDPDECLWLCEQISCWHREHDVVDPTYGPVYEYTDSFRLGVKGDEASEAAYTQEMTCCGSVDVEFGPSPKGVTYLYGFNHGH